MILVNIDLLNPQNLLKYGQEKLMKKQLLTYGIDSPKWNTNDCEFLSLRMGHTRNLTPQKYKIHRAIEILLRTSPDVYIYGK